MIIGFIKDMVFDKAIDVAFDELKGTFSAEQALEYDIVDTRDTMATMILMMAFGLIPTSIIVSNILFWSFDISGLYIFLVNLLIPYAIYRAIRNKINKLLRKVKFMLTLKDNLMKISTDSKVKIEKFLSKFGK